jgi:phage terminase Nu1 subunit (DNA packaging protein)
MLIDVDRALNALAESLDWKRPAPDADELFDSIAAVLHRRFPELTITQIDLLLADLKREYVHDAHVAEWDMYAAFRCTIGGED